MSEAAVLPEDINWSNPLENRDSVELDEYLEFFKTRITQESEVLFVRQFLYPLLGSKNIKYVVPQYPFLDSEGRSRRIDFALLYDGKKVALEVNGETYHAEGIIPNENFDDNLNRQNEILNAGWFLLRYSYSQLQSPTWSKRVSDSLFSLLRKKVPALLSQSLIEPNYLQKQVLEALDFYRGKGWKKGIVILPTGTGKTFLSAFDTLRAPGRILFIVHRLDILMQSREAYEKIYPNEKLGYLAGDTWENVTDSKVLFASKDTLKNPKVLEQFAPDEFDYVIVDEVHHGQAPTYQTVLNYFQPNFFMLGLTATPDRLDRKDIFELFDYQKVFEYTLTEAIDNGFLVPYTYYGLLDNIDYNNIRHNGVKYNVADLDRHLIIDARNEKILEEYLTKGSGNKAVGFCASVKHADTMAKFFSDRGVPAKSITSYSTDKEQLIKDFRDSKYTVAFTVDLFNEGVDIPDLRTLLFLRPTESKTVFFQQLGRGLRLCGGKEGVVIIDFIGNYKKANNIRKFLSKGQKDQKNDGNGRVEKTLYEYSPKCEVIFEAEVEQILDREDAAGRDITREDLVDAYYTVVEKLSKKPSQDEINREGEFRVSKYVLEYGSWNNFLKSIGEQTEFSYHFPQGTHMGHVLYILKTIGQGTVAGSHIRPDYVRFVGAYDPSKKLGGFQRQTKYKLQAAMEMGLLVDYRKAALEEEFGLTLTAEGQHIFDVLQPLFAQLDLAVPAGEGDDASWTMAVEGSVNTAMQQFLAAHPAAQTAVRKKLLRMDAVSLLLKYLYSIERKVSVARGELYAGFFQAPFITAYLDRHGLDVPTEEVRVRRIPFLINILESLGLVRKTSTGLDVLGFVLNERVLQLDPSDKPDTIANRIGALRTFAKTGQVVLEAEELSRLKEAFGPDFLTADYHLPIIEE